VVKLDFWAAAGAHERGDAAGKLHIAPAERNRGPILAVLRELLPERARAIEIGSGTGQHAAYFTAEWAGLTWQPTDASTTGLASVAAYRAESDATRLLEPLALDVTRDALPPGPWDAVFAANVIHIAPWEVSRALLREAAGALGPGGLLILYGPFRFSGAFTAQSNADFDARLRGSDPAWGVRDLDDLSREASPLGFARPRTFALPANNHVVAFRRG
jgi:SAM-dependent methyltransferase